MSENNANVEKLQDYLNVLLEKLSPDQKARATSCKTLDELMDFIKAEAIELPDELMSDVIGGLDYKHAFLKADGGDKKLLRVTFL